MRIKVTVETLTRWEGELEVDGAANGAAIEQALASAKDEAMLGDSEIIHQRTEYEIL